MRYSFEASDASRLLADGPFLSLKPDITDGRGKRSKSDGLVFSCDEKWHCCQTWKNRKDGDDEMQINNVSICQLPLLLQMPDF